MIRLPPHLARAGIAVGLLALAFSLGRGCKPAPVEVEARERIVYRDRVEVLTLTVQAEAKRERRNVERTRETRPDGTVFERELDLSASESLRLSQTDTHAVQERAADVTTSRVERPALARWRAGLTLDAAPHLVPPGFTSPVLGLQAEHRLAGPLWLGVRVSTARTLGLSLAVELP